MEYYLKSLKIDETLGNKADIAMSLTNLGGIYFNQAYDQSPQLTVSNKDSLTNISLDYLEKSFKIYEEIGNLAGVAMTLNNIGMIYHSRATEAMAKLNISGNMDGSSRQVDSLGKDELRRMFDKTYEYYSKSMSISEELGDKCGIITALNNIALIHFDRSEINKSFACAQKAYLMYKEAGCVVDTRIAAKLLEQIYAIKGNWKLSRQYYGEYITMRTSVLKEESQKLIQNKYYQYQYDKKATADSITHSKAMEISKLEIEAKI